MNSSRLRRGVAATLMVVATGALVVSTAGCRERGPGKAADTAKPGAVAPGSCPEIKLPPSRPRTVRPAAVAGSWYAGDPVALGEQLDTMLAKASPPASGGKGPIRALISPHAGYKFSGAGAAAGYKLLRGQRICRVVVLGPAHRGAFAGLSIADVTHYTTPLGDIPLDFGTVARLRHHPLVTADPDAHRAEHSIEMQLPLLQRVLGPGWSLVPILVGSLDRPGYAKAAELLRLLADEQTLFVASGDFTHYGPNYGYLPFPSDDNVATRLRELDMGALKHIEVRDADGFATYRERTGITACGFGPVSILLDLLTEITTSTLVRYYTSGEVLGDYTNSVSYLTVAFKAEVPFALTGAPDELTADQMTLLHRLARRTLDHAVNRGADAVDPEALAAELALPPVLRRKGGAFVTLRKYGGLRGCIGHIYPVEPLYRSVIANAVSAALRDTRFTPVTPAELGELAVEVSVLSAPSPIPSIADFEVGHHGIIITKGGRRAVFLPEVAAERGWTREETLTELSAKAGLPSDAWRSGSSFEVFTAQVFEVPY